jgi:hypothetical protein
VLQNASKEYVKEDSCALESFPTSAESLNDFDALIFINPVLDWLTADQRDALREYFSPELRVASNELREDLGKLHSFLVSVHLVYPIEKQKAIPGTSKNERR